MKKNVYIIGVGRSGTSLLQSMLNAHPEVCFLPETHFFRQYLSSDKKIRHFKSAGIEEFAKTLKSDSYFERVGLTVSELLSDTSSGDTEFNILDIYHNLLNRYCSSQTVSIIGDKDPKIIDCLPQLSKLLPNAYIIHIIRDPRDVLISRMKAKWSSSRPYWLHPMIYNSQLSLGRANGPRLFGERYLELHYEDLISAPETALSNACQFLGIPYSDKMLTFGQSAKELVSPNELEWKKETFGPLLKDNKEKWRTQLTPWQVILTEIICKQVFETAEYHPVTSDVRLGFTESLLLKSISLVSYFFNRLYLLILKIR